MPTSARPQRVRGLPLEQVAALAGAALPGSAAPPGGVPALRVTGVVLDSRACHPGDLYAALPGARTHGARFAAQAEEHGAVALLTDPEGAALAAAAGSHVPAVVVADPRAVLGAVSAGVWGEPAAHLQLLGVTGTNGKTTVTTLLGAALEVLGTPSALIGTVCTRIAGVVLPSARTTPEAPDLHALLALAVERGARAAALEVSSHAVALHRVDGLVLDVAAFTNLSHDHLDFHPTMEHYFAAKAALFTRERARRAVVCVDDPWGRRLAAMSARAGVPTTTVSTTSADGGWWVDPASVRMRTDGHPGSAFTLHLSDGPRSLELEAASPLPGTFNVANTAVAVAVLAAAGHDPAAAAAALAGAPGVPGRMEVVPSGAGAPRGVVDYAHTPDAVAAALAALRPSTAGPLVVVLGAGGDRDPGKRGAMGAAAARGADVVVVTDDNPRSEVPAAVRAAVLAGARAAAAPTCRVVEVASRRDAIAAALPLAGASGTVLLAGKGHEPGQEVDGVVHPFDDRVELAAALAALTRTPAGVGR